MTPRLSRRGVLAGMAGFGVAGVGLTTRLGRRPPYTHYTHAQTQGTERLLRVAWAAFYNGAVVEAQNGSTETNATRILYPGTSPLYVDEVSGPVITLGNVVPGDGGALAVGLLVEALPEGEEAMDIWVRATLTENLENGAKDPEIWDPKEDDPGDGSSDGELAGATRSLFWRDEGMVAGVGRCNGTHDPGEDVLHRGRLAGIETDLGGGVQLAECLVEGTNRCYGLEWDLPTGVGNHVQGDSVAFDLTFVAASCGSGNPFGTLEGSDE